MVIISKFRNFITYFAKNFEQKEKYFTRISNSYNILPFNQQITIILCHSISRILCFLCLALTFLMPQGIRSVLRVVFQYHCQITATSFRVRPEHQKARNPNHLFRYETTF